MNKGPYLIIFLYLLIRANFCFSQIDSITHKNVSDDLKEIIKLLPETGNDEKVKIATLSETNINEAPGCVTVITSTEIENAGFADLQDVLEYVSGFNLTADNQNGISISSRGFWTNEAKLKVMIDNLPINELAYGSFNLFLRIPLINIERIEIIKGAGSSIYGGNAGLGVINIITREGQNKLGSNKFGIAGGIANNGITRKITSYSYNAHLLNDFEISGSAALFHGVRSNLTTTLPNGTDVSYKDSSETSDVFLQLKIKKKTFEFKTLYEDYNFQATYDQTYSLVRHILNEVSKEFILRKFSIKPYLISNNQIPWLNQFGAGSSIDDGNFRTTQIKSGFQSNWKLKNAISFVSGGEFTYDKFKHFKEDLPLNNGELENKYYGFALFGEFVFKTKLANIYVGNRFDKYAYFKGNNSPRISITKNFSNWNYKLIYGKSFKIPTLQNIHLDADNELIPEIVRDYQMEIGYKNETSQIKFNAFYTKLLDNIAYTFEYDSQGGLVEFYENSGSVNTAGFEIELRKKIKQFSIKANYSYYRLLTGTDRQYVVDTANLTLGNFSIPTHRFTANLFYEVDEKNKIAANYIFQGIKYGYEEIDIESQIWGNYKYAPTHAVDLIYQRKNLFRVFNVNVGIHNLLNTKTYIVYNSNGEYYPTLKMGRELFIQLMVNV
jgi:outer membrane cobalamin receptor